MKREQHSARRYAPSQLSRRQYLLTTGAVGSGAIAVVGRTASAADVTVAVTVPTVDHDWTAVELSSTFDDPVVVAPAVSYHGPNPASPRLRDVATDGFDLSIEEWHYLDGFHLRETVGCFVADAGTSDPASGPAFETDRVRTNHQWSSVSFDGAFDDAPVVLSNAQTVAESQPVVTRTRDVSESGVALRLQTSEAAGPHGTETVAYLAIAPGTGRIDGTACEVETVADVTDDWQTVSFSARYRRPVFLADLQTNRGSNTATVRYRNLTGSGVEVKVEEERSADRETAHLGERVGYVVLEGDAEHDGGYGVGTYSADGYGE